MINEALINELGDIVKYHRRKSGLSRLKLAGLAQVGKTAIFDIEHNKTAVQFDTLLKVLEVLNIKIELTSPLMEIYRKDAGEKS